MPEEQTPEQIREEARNTHKQVLADPGLKSLYIAAKAGLSTARYGEEGKRATMLDYVNGVGSGTPGVAKVVGKAYAQSALKAMQAGKDPREVAGPLPRELLENAQTFFESSWPDVYVADALEMLGISNVNEARVSTQDRAKTIAELSQSNKKLYGQLTDAYFGGIVDEGVGKALIRQSQMNKHGLEEMLQSAPQGTGNSPVVA